MFCLLIPTNVHISLPGPNMHHVPINLISPLHEWTTLVQGFY